jgi:hypothetical protein
MRILVCLCVLLAACEPGVEQHITVTPAEAWTQDSARNVASTVMDVLGRRHAMKPVSMKQCSVAYRASYQEDSPRPHVLHLQLCLHVSANSLGFTLSEGFTTRWGSRGDSLRRELRDTLVVLFGDKAVKSRS